MRRAFDFVLASNAPLCEGAYASLSIFPLLQGFWASVRKTYDGQLGMFAGRSELYRPMERLLWYITYPSHFTSRRTTVIEGDLQLLPCVAPCPEFLMVVNIFLVCNVLINYRARH